VFASQAKCHGFESRYPLNRNVRANGRFLFCGLRHLRIHPAIGRIYRALCIIFSAFFLFLYGKINFSGCPPLLAEGVFAVAETFTLEAQPRTITGKKVSQLRNQGLVPGVIYGSTTQPVSLQVPYRSLELTLMHAGGNHLIDIAVDGQTHTVLARAVQRDVIKGRILHVDFLAVNANETITTDIHLRMVGESPAARLGVLVYGSNTITIQSLPRNLPEVIEVDISVLKNVGDVIHVSDLKLGDNITILTSPEDLVVRVNALQAATEETEAGTTPSEPELVRRERAERED
jgi:large subunit ribosomal protein L25